jgi:hypothetical protein
MSGWLRISRRDVVELCEQLFSSRISAGTVDAILSRAADALAEPHADLLTELRSASAVNMDETGWRTAGERRALWGIFDQRHAYLPIRTDRTSACTRRTRSSSKDGALTGSLCSIAQFEQLPCEQDRLLEVQGKRSLSVCVQPHSSHSLALPVMELSLWHGPNATELAPRKLDRHNYLYN